MSSLPSPWILIIEDVRDQAELWSDVCAEGGLNASTASSGEQGYQRAVNTQPALILLDLMLPDIDGWEVCRRLKTDDRTKNIPVVILTARDEPQAMRRAQELGCAAYLKKPCPPAQFLSVIRKQLQLRGD